MSTLYRITFALTRKVIPNGVNSSPICDSPLRDRRGASSFRYRNRAKIIVLMCVQKPYPVWLSFRRMRKTYPV